MKTLTALSLILVLTIGCKSKENASQAKKEGDKMFTILKQDQYGGRAEESHELVTSQKELDGLYKELDIHKTDAVDFDTHNVIAVFMGQKNTGGYSITIDKVVVEGHTASVLTKSKVPEPGAMVTMGLSQPYCIAVIPKTENVSVKENPLLIKD